MAFNFEEIIARQDECFGNIKKLCVNYKKDGSERKTKSYLTARLTALDSHWGEFQLNNDKLMKQENKTHAYYVNQVYEKTKLLTEDVRNDILSRLEKFATETLPETQTSLKSNFDFEEINNTIHETPTGVKVQELSGEKIQELMKQQQCNFKAFERSATKINLDLIAEKWKLEDHLNILKAKWNTVDKTHWEIDYILQGSNSQYQKQYSTLETRYDDLKREISKKVWNSAHYEKTTPRIEIPDFYGSYTQWVSFKDLFTESVHTNPLLSKTQKMQLLKSKLKGEAEKLIQHLSISAENYDSCWEILQHRYNNERLLFTSFMNTLLNQQSIQQPNAFNIKKLHDVTLECLNGLTNIGLDITTWDPVIVHLISQKLDSSTYGEYIRDLESPRDLPNLEEFIKFLETKFMAFETMQRNQNHKQVTTVKPSNYNHYSTYKSNNRPSYATKPRFNNYYKDYNAYRSTHYNKQEMMPKTYCMTAKSCPLCKTTSHVLMQCDKLLSMSPDGRNDTVSRLQLCKNCLYSHGNKQCFSRKTCKECQQSHHTLLHQYENPITSNSGERSNTASFQGNRNVNNITNKEKEVLLATLKLQAQCIDGTYITLRALLDQGSQMNLISEEAAQRLRLPRQRVSAGFKGVGTISGKCKGVINLNCKSVHSDAEFKVQPFIINKLINNLSSTSFVAQGWNYLELMKRGGFNLRKWSSNEPAVLRELKEEQKCLQNTINFNQDGSSTSPTKTLGIRWNPIEDTYLFNWQLPEIKRLTKRALLSEISKLYDPMGWLSPTTIKAKLIFQKVWSTKLEWDELLPNEITEEWENLRRDLPNVNKLRLRRWVHCSEHNIEIHGFCDASDKAYACVIYSKTRNETGEPVTTLLAAKTKAAPLKTKLTTPRMELCGAVLLTKLVKKLQNTFINKQLEIICWTDSQVVLAWLQGEPTKWQSYVASRVTLINKTLPGIQWRYVKSDKNPADCASRGLSPSQLLNFKLWWEGPQLIQTYNEVNLSQQERSFVTENELKTTCLALQRDTQTCTSVIHNLLHKYSTLTRVIRVASWLLRWLYQYRNKNTTMEDNISLPEQQQALKLIIKQVQEHNFGEDLHHLKQTGTVSKKSRLLTLSPFVDEDGLIRVRGRLENSTLSAEAKHPIILPPSGRLTEMIINEAHNKTLHGGARLTLANTRLQYWILGGNATVKKYLRCCVRCHRFKPHKNEQIMADLPSERLTPSRPFTNTGIDFTGYVDIKINKGRGVKTNKAYIALFICMVTKAVHLELVSDLSTETFIAAFRRMCGRRGTPKNVFTDNGTNFVGAEKLLRKEFEENETLTSPELRREMTYQRINWKFNAPLWPSGGGLWEAAVKSMKYHLKRVLGEQKLTFEEFTTLLTEIEACMNSRPLSPLTEDPDDLDYLTPGHFLIGGPIISLPQRDDGANKINIINRWKLLEHMKLQIWKRWSNEYLYQLQIRSKWQRPRKNLEKGDLVLIQENNIPPGRWALGRIIELHPGTDGHIRVVTLKTKGGYLKRPIIKLAPLPIKDNEENNTTDRPAQKHDIFTNTTQPNETEETTPRRSNVTTNSRVTFNCFTILAMLFMTFTVTYCDAANYKIMNLQQDQPIYFDEIGNLQLIHDQWTLLTYYNLTTYWQASRDIVTYIDKIDGTCKRMTHAPCDAVVKQLRHEASHLTEYNTFLLSQHMARRRRSYFDGVGNLMRYMFGVLELACICISAQV